VSTPSLRESVAEAAQTLATGGRARDDARRDAALLARWVLRWSMEDWLTRQHEIAPPEFKTPFDDLIARRAAGEPIAYLVGTREFYGRQFRVRPGVLIPRPETEWTVEEALAAIGAASGREARSLQVVDIGTGSGCVAITIALERPDVRVTATDISPDALDVARTNADLLGAGARVQFVAADLLPDLDGPADVIVTNPPYVREDERDQLDIEVRDHEPAQALFAGRDGLDVIRRLVPLAARALVPGGMLVMEIGAGQAAAVSSIIAASDGLALHGIREDLQAIPRVIVAMRQ
jgi:release factor glutamine methyltransferase